MNNNYRLQLRHGAEGKAFSTRDEVISYINGQLQYGKVELLPYEPILFFYGADDAKNTIIMVGLPEGKTQDGKSYFLVDTANLQEQINEGESEAKDLSEKLDKEIENRKTADEALQTAIDGEIEDRKSADEDEAKLRDEADKALEQLISDEAKKRKAADATETKAREDADTAEEKARKEADEKETEERKTADEDLQEFIDFSADDIQSLIDACGVIYNEKLAEGRVSYDPDSHDEVIRDAKSLSEAIDKVSKFATNLGQTLKVSVENTDTVDLTMEEDSKNGGSVIKAEVNIAGTDGLSKKVFDNNIIGKTSEGIYAAASIEPSTTKPNVLIFKTSGYVDGQFKADAYETEVPLSAYKGDNGKTTGITVDVDADKNVISATLNLSSEESNILKLEDGEYVVEGLAKNIKYKDTTVANVLTKHSSRLDDIEDAIDGVKAVEVKGSETSTSTVSVEKSNKGDFTVSNDVKLSSDNSIVVANGGLSANVNASFKKGTSTLTINVGNTPYNIDLSELAVSVLKSATYDSVTEEIVLTFIVGDAEKTMRIPVGTLIHDVEVDDTDSIDLTLKSVSGGPNHISGEVRVDKTHSDNILTVSSNGLYVSQAYITNAVKEEAQSRKDADTALQTQVNKVSDLANANKENISVEQTRAEKAEKANADAIAQEIKDARKAESDNAANIATNSESIKANTEAIADEIARAQKAEQTNTDAITAEVNRAKKAEGDNANNISAEIDRAKEKENDLLASIGTNASAIKENKNAIDAEAKTARAAEKTNAEAITAEVTRAKEVEGVNTKAISDEAIRAKGVEDGLSTAIVTEKERATTAETTLGANIAAEVTRAKDAEDKLSVALTTAQTALEEKVKEEETRAKAEEALKANASDVYTKNEITTKLGDYATTKVVETKANTADVYTKNDITTMLGDYATTTAVAAKADASNVYTKNDITTMLGDYAKSADVATGLATKLSTTDAENVYATKESLGDYATSKSVSDIETNLSGRIEANETSIDNFGLTYNAATSELTYKDKNGTQTIYKLYSGSLVKGGTFDTKSNSIVLTIENAGVESKITIPVSELLSDISGRITTNENNIAAINTSISKLAKNWTVKSSSTVDLTKDTSGENDSLTADVKVATSNKQAIQSTDNGLYVSNDLEDYTVVYGETGTISAQTAISKLLSTITSVNSNLQTQITANSGKITTLTEKVDANAKNISNIQADIKTAQNNISSLQTDVATNKGSIATLNTTVANIQTNLTDYAKRISTAETNIASINTTLSSVKDSVTKIQNSVETLSESITSLETTIKTITGDGGDLATLKSDMSKVKTATGFENYTSTKTMSARLDTLETEGGADVKAEIENIEKNLIGDKTNPADGSIWAEINNMIDAGTF
jgi:hypothetical protein